MDMAELILLAPHFSSTSSPLRTSTSSSDAYILSIASLPSQYAASSSLPSNKINIFDKSSLRLAQTLPGHQGATTALKSISAIGGNNGKISLVSSGKDGTVVVWDDRTNSPGLKMMNPSRSQPILCFDVSPDGMTVAAGTDLQGEDALIHYWDPRKPSAPLRTHSSTHSDDITTLSFLPSRAPENSLLLLSGSSDGLISISNADEADEDEAILHVANWGCSISQAGWIQGQQQQASIWAASDMETFSTWTDQLEPLLGVDIRKPSVYSHGRAWVTDYLIGCVTKSLSSTLSGSPSLGVFVGSNEGDIALLSHSDLTTAGAAWNIHRQWSNGHVGIVRALLWDEEYNVIVSGGEDAKINIWSGPGIVDIDDAMEDTNVYRKRETSWDDEHEGKRARR